MRPAKTNHPIDAERRDVVADPVGELTLELFRKNDGYTAFLWEALSSLLNPEEVRGRVLEVGCGIGNLTRLVLSTPEVTYVHSIDVDPAYVDRVARDIVDPRLVVSTDRAESFCPPEYTNPDEGFDIIVSSNVLEHIDDHVQVLKNWASMLRPGGRVLLLVPAHRFLYSGLDRDLSHFRRYTTRDLSALLPSTGLKACRMRYFNPLGGMGWWFNGKVLRRRILPEGQLSFYARFAIPLSRLCDRINPFPFGVSLLAVIEKQATSAES